MASLVLLVSTLLASCGSGAQDTGELAVITGQEDGSGLHGAVLDEPYALRDARLVDTQGRRLRLVEELEAPLTLVFFGYTHCPDICIAVLADLASAQARLSAEEAAQVETWVVTTDPARDGPEVLRAYLDRFDPAFEGWTGPLREITALASSAHIALERGPRLDTGGYEVTHGTPVLGVRPDGTVPVLWTEGTSAAKLAEDLTRILDDGVPGEATG